MSSLWRFGLMIFIVVMTACGRRQSVRDTKVKLTGTTDSTIIIFDRDSTRIYFGKKELVNYCEKSRNKYVYEKKVYSIRTVKGDTSVSFGWNDPETIIFKGDTIELANRAAQNYLYGTKDTVVSLKIFMDTIVDRDTKLLHFLAALQDTTITIKDSFVTYLDTIVDFSDFENLDSIPFPDWSAAQTQYADALNWAMIEILRTGKAKVFDVAENKFVDYIIIKDLEDNLSGDVEMYLPNGKMFYHQMLWIQ